MPWARAVPAAIALRHVLDPGSLPPVLRGTSLRPCLPRDLRPPLPCASPRRKVRGDRRNKRSSSTLLQDMTHCQRATVCPRDRCLIGDSGIYDGSYRARHGRVRINSVIASRPGACASDAAGAARRPLDRRLRRGLQPGSAALRINRRHVVPDAGAYDSCFFGSPRTGAGPRGSERRIPSYIHWKDPPRAAAGHGCCMPNRPPARATEPPWRGAAHRRRSRGALRAPFRRPRRVRGGSRGDSAVRSRRDRDLWTR